MVDPAVFEAHCHKPGGCGWSESSADFAAACRTHVWFQAVLGFEALRCLAVGMSDFTACIPPVASCCPCHPEPAKLQPKAFAGQGGIWVPPVFSTSNPNLAAVCLSVCLSLCLSVSVCMFVSACLCLTYYCPTVCLSVSLSLSLPLSFSLCRLVSVTVSVSLLVCMDISYIYIFIHASIHTYMCICRYIYTADVHACTHVCLQARR